MHRATVSDSLAARQSPHLDVTAAAIWRWPTAPFRPRRPQAGQPGEIAARQEIGQLIARVDRSWDTRDELRGKIHDRIQALRTRAAQISSGTGLRARSL
jgi:hypothetical protein